MQHYPLLDMCRCSTVQRGSSQCMSTSRALAKMESSASRFLFTKGTMLN